MATGCLLSQHNILSVILYMKHWWHYEWGRQHNFSGQILIMLNSIISLLEEEGLNT